MPFDLDLPRDLARQWKVRIRDREDLVETPHVTVIRRRFAWRLDPRTHKFMDKDPDPSDVPSAVLEVIEANWEMLCEQWDVMFPENKVESYGDEEDFDD